LSIGTSYLAVTAAQVQLESGGWTYSNDHGKFHPIVVSPSLRSEFVRSSIRLLEDYGFDGLDIDYEYPTKHAEYHGYLQLLEELREGLDEHQRKKGINYKFLLTVSRSPSSVNGISQCRVDRRTLWSTELRQTFDQRNGQIPRFLELDGL
jgi:GH18 family chitinase